MSNSYASIERLCILNNENAQIIMAIISSLLGVITLTQVQASEIGPSK